MLMLMLKVKGITSTASISTCSNRYPKGSEGDENRELALRNAIERLDGVRVQHTRSVNQLIKYRRRQSEGRRMSKGKGKAKAKAKTMDNDDASSAGAGENLSGATNDDYDDDDDDGDDDAYNLIQ
ncbi:hypothetical protein BGZ58_004505 [Dissophora ornata]|nr:hypothetical protein BGZ58_004505 [Dissophora ornata]